MEKSKMKSDKSTRKLNLERKSEQELNDLLKMQENLLQNKYLIQSLPDKGQKILEFIDEIQQTLKAKDSIDQTADGLERMQLDLPGTLSDKIEDAVLRDLQQFVNNPSKEKIVTDERRNYRNSYEFIMKRNNLQAESLPINFRPNRLPSKTINSDAMITENSLPIEPTVDSVPFPTLKENIVLDGKGEEPSCKLKHKYDASLEEQMCEKGRSHIVKTISIEESIELIGKHFQAVKEAELKRAEAILLANSEIKMSTDKNEWHGEKFSKYRDEPTLNVDDQDEDDDDDDEEDGHNVICGADDNSDSQEND